jgi:hypothetical protein
MLMNSTIPVRFDPGIPGFIKAMRHHSGPVLVMTEFTLSQREWFGVFWVKRLVHNANRWAAEYFPVFGDKTRQDAERYFDYMLLAGPPPAALTDSQRVRVYEWEDDNIMPMFDHPMPWSACLFFTKYVWERVGGRNPLILSNESRVRCALSMGGKIHIPEDLPAFHTKPVLLHEIAHELTRGAQHGPEFVSTYMDLCVRFLGIDREYLEDSAIRYGVRYLS